MAISGGINVGGIYGEISLDNRGFRQVLSQSKSDLARAALEMERASRIRVDISEWKKLNAQLVALQQRAHEVRVKLNQAFQHGESTRDLETELRNLQKRIKLLRDTTEPTRKELERLSRAGRGVQAGGRGTALREVREAVTGALPGQLGGIVAAAGSSPWGAAATAAIAGITGAAAAAYKAATATGAYAEEIKNLAQQTGLGTTRLQELKIVAENSGLSFDTITRAVTQVQRKLMEIERGSGAAAETMRRLGISVHDSRGKLRSMDDLFPEIIKKLQSMTNVSERNMLAAQIFGRGFGELAPILGMTAAEFERATRQARELGLVMSERELAQAAAFDDQMDELRQTLAGLARQVGIAVIPVFSSLAKKLLSAWPAIKQAIIDWWNRSKPMFAALWDALKNIWDILKPILKLVGMNVMAQAAAAVKILTAAFKTLAGVLAGIKTILTPILTAIGWVANTVAGTAKTAKSAQSAQSGAASAASRSANKPLTAEERKRLQNEIKTARGRVSSTQRDLREVLESRYGPAAVKRALQQTGGDVVAAAESLSNIRFPRGTGVYGEGKNRRYYSDTELREIQNDMLAKIKRLNDEINSKREQLAVVPPAQPSTAVATPVPSPVRATGRTPKITITEITEEVRRQREAEEDARRTAEEQQRNHLERMLNTYRDWARKMLDSMRKFNDETLDEIRDQLRREQEARDQAAEQARSRYEKLIEIGRAGAMAMTNIVMFRGSAAAAPELTPAAVTPERIQAAAEAVRRRHEEQAAMERAVNAELFGGTVNTLNRIAGISTPTENSASQQINILRALLDYAQRQLFELQKLNMQQVTT